MVLLHCFSPLTSSWTILMFHYGNNSQSFDPYQESFASLTNIITFLNLTHIQCCKAHSFLFSGVIHNSIINKHCEILVSCSDEERNCMQAHETVCKLLELHVSSLNLMKAHGTACKLMYLCASFCNCMQVYVTACKLMDLLAFWDTLHAFFNILEHSACIL